MNGIYPKSGKGKGFVLPVQACLIYPKLQDANERKKSIIENTMAVFVVEDRFIEDASAPIYELCSMNPIKKYNNSIKIEAANQDVDPDLIRSIMYMETSHGWYDVINPMRKTILPMNIHYEYWKGLGFSKEQLEKPETNIHVGTLILKRIQDRLEDPKISKIASVYNFLGKEYVSVYGESVARIYRERTWEKC